MKKYISQFLICVCIIFTCQIMLFTCMEALRPCGLLGVSFIFSILLSSFITAGLQLICFTPILFKRLEYFWRLLIFAVTLCSALLILAVAFKWIPELSFDAVSIFLGIFLGIFFVMSLIFSLVFRHKNKEYNGLLGAYKKGIETPDGSLPKPLRSSIGIPYDDPLVYPTTVKAIELVSSFCEKQGYEFSFSSDKSVTVNGKSYEIVIAYAGRFGYTIRLREN